MFAHKHLLSIDDLSPEDIMTVLKQARTFEEINERPHKKCSCTSRENGMQPVS